MDFDETRLYYSHQQLQTEEAEAQGDGGGEQPAAVPQGVSQEEEDIHLPACRRHFREFLRE